MFKNNLKCITLYIRYIAIFVEKLSNKKVDISIKTATPLLLLPLISAFFIFNNLTIAAVLGFICGAALDSVSAETYCFDTIFFFIIAAAVNLSANYLFNKNVLGALAISLISCSLYFGANWILFHAFDRTFKDSIGYLLTYAAPSAVYSAIFIIPFFYVYKMLENKKEQ